MGGTAAAAVTTVWTVLASFSGLFGLIGVILGAGVTGLVQARNARREREAVVRAAARDAVRELFAMCDIVDVSFQRVWMLDNGQDQPVATYERAAGAWTDYVQACARVRLVAPAAVSALVPVLSEALFEHTLGIENYYRRLTGYPSPTHDEIAASSRRLQVAKRPVETELNRAVPLPPWSRPSIATRLRGTRSTSHQHDRAVAGPIAEPSPASGPGGPVRSVPRTGVDG